MPATRLSPETERRRAKAGIDATYAYLFNSTVSGNHADHGPVGGVYAAHEAQIFSCTITANTGKGAFAAGLYGGFAATPTSILQSTIIAGNTRQRRRTRRRIAVWFTDFGKQQPDQDVPEWNEGAIRHDCRRPAARAAAGQRRTDQDARPVAGQSRDRQRKRLLGRFRRLARLSRVSRKQGRHRRSRVRPGPYLRQRLQSIVDACGIARGEAADRASRCDGLCNPPRPRFTRQDVTGSARRRARLRYAQLECSYRAWGRIRVGQRREMTDA